MDEPPDYYEVLQVHPRAGQEIIQRAYRTLSRSYHPDANPPDKRAWASEMMSRLNQAYAVLSDPAARREYDARRAETGSVAARARQRSSSAVSGAVRPCHWHAQRPRVSICTVCGRSVCAECRRTQGMAVVCPECRANGRQIEVSTDVVSSSRNTQRERPPRSGAAAAFREFFGAGSLHQAAFATMHVALGALALALWLRGLVLLAAFRFPDSLRFVWPLGVTAAALSVAAIAVGLVMLRGFRRPGALMVVGLALTLLAVWAFYSLRLQPYAQMADTAREQGRLNDAIAGYSLALWNAGHDDTDLRRSLGLVYLDAFASQKRGSPISALGALRYLATCSDPARLQTSLKQRQHHPIAVEAPERHVGIYMAARALDRGGVPSARMWTRAVDILSPAALNMNDIEQLPASHRLVLGLAVHKLSRAVQSLPTEQLSRLNRRYQDWISETVTGQESKRGQQGGLEKDFRAIAQQLLKTNNAKLDAAARSTALHGDLTAALEDLSPRPSRGQQAAPQHQDTPANIAVPPAPVENDAPTPEPVPQRAAPPADELSPAGAPFVGNSASHVYHRPDCKHLPEPDNRVGIWSAAHAASEGYQPCEHCKPDEVGGEVSAE